VCEDVVYQEPDWTGYFLRDHQNWSNGF